MQWVLKVLYLGRTEERKGRENLLSLVWEDPHVEGYKVGEAEDFLGQ